jgi:signal transduction histidine kinase/CheY-like chemotaxis protein
VLAEQEAVHAGAALRERDKRLQLALDGAGMSIWCWDPLLDQGDLDDRGCAILGFPAGDIPSLHTTIASHVHPDDRETMAGGFAACIDPAGDGRLELEYRHRRPDGREIWVRLTGYARFVGDGPGRHADLVMGTLQDVSARHGTELALRESDSRFRMLFDAIDEGFCVIDMVYDADGRPCDYRFALTNAAFERQTGMVDAVGRCMREFAPDHEQMWYDRYGQIAADGEAQRFEMRAEALGRWYDVYAFRIGAPEERRLGVLFNDVSDRRHAEASLRASEAQLSALVAQLAEADRRKNEFLATLAHELRNPLSPLTTAAYLLGLDGGDPDGSLRAMIQRQVQQMTRLVDDLLDISRISRGKVNLQKVALDLVGVVGSAAQTCAPMIESHGHRLELQLPSLPVIVQGDETRLSQVVSNLLHNAAKYTPRGGRIALTMEVVDGDAVVVVEDSGIGLPADALEEVFGMFAQLPDARGRAQGGLGIGLALARRMAELHGGTLHAESEGLDRGSRFVLRLPVTPAPSPALSKPGAVASAGKAAVVQRVLVVDDNRDAADSLANLLRILGHEVRVGYDGPTGLALAEEFRPQLCLLDIGMPEMDGRALARAIRERSWGRDVRLAAVSGWGQREDREQSHNAGFDDHVAKPIDLATLERILRAAMPAP